MGQVHVSRTLKEKSQKYFFETCPTSSIGGTISPKSFGISKSVKMSVYDPLAVR
jgi:hypothetical protein